MAKISQAGTLTGLKQLQSALQQLSHYQATETSMTGRQCPIEWRLVLTAVSTGDCLLAATAEPAWRLQNHLYRIISDFLKRGYERK